VSQGELKRPKNDRFYISPFSRSREIRQQTAPNGSKRHQSKKVPRYQRIPRLKLSFPQFSSTHVPANSAELHFFQPFPTFSNPKQKMLRTTETASTPAPSTIDYQSCTAYYRSNPVYSRSNGSFAKGFPSRVCRSRRASTALPFDSKAFHRTRGLISDGLQRFLPHLIRVHPCPSVVKNLSTLSSQRSTGLPLTGNGAILSFANSLGGYFSPQRIRKVIL
jgi:hypothetical protein